jgi:uncharacterized membrane protein/predicted DsbA family dithiol-disulfide isomerase
MPTSNRQSSSTRAAFAASLTLALVGVVLSGLLVRVHHDAASGLTSFCTISEEINCDRVALSRWSVVLGVPLAVWGVAAYAMVGVMAAWGLTARRLHPRWPAGFLLAAGAAMSLASLALAFISKSMIGAWCLLCVGSWATSLGLLVAGWLACRPAGVAEAVRADLVAVGRFPRRAAILAIAGVIGVLLLVAAYPRVEAGAAAPVVVRGAANSSGPRPSPLPAATGPAVLFSDYLCPVCARAHLELGELLRVRPDIQVIRRHFPLDSTCNPALKRQKHPGACDLARAAICAEAQGQFTVMDDALFASQESHVPLEQLVARLGLDAMKFTACLAAPATAARLADDIADGTRAKIGGTPAYVVDGRPLEGWHFPIERFPPPPGDGPPRPSSPPRGAR